MGHWLWRVLEKGCSVHRFWLDAGMKKPERDQDFEFELEGRVITASCYDVQPDPGNPPHGLIITGLVDFPIATGKRCSLRGKSRPICGRIEHVRCNRERTDWLFDISTIAADGDWDA